ncbi:MAG: hypothetical protein IPP14_15705 [Planctomycetes bacterium]|nr:hypothetical protein [Planctomycetota bacterium]
MSVIDAARGPKLQTYNPGNLANNMGVWITAGDSTITFDQAEDGPGIDFGTDSTDNDCATMAAAGEVVPVATTASNFGFEAVFMHTEGSTSAANWFIGFSDVTGSTFFGDTGALATMDAIGIYKVESSLFFRTCALNAAAQSGETTTTAYASATQYRIRVDARVYADGVTIKFYVNEVLIDTVTGFTATNMTAMQPVVAVANGAGAAETLTLRQFVPYANALAA